MGVIPPGLPTNRPESGVYKTQLEPMDLQNSSSSARNCALSVWSERFYGWKGRHLVLRKDELDRPHEVSAADTVASAILLLLTANLGQRWRNNWFSSDLYEAISSIAHRRVLAIRGIVIIRLDDDSFKKDLKVSLSSCELWNELFSLKAIQRKEICMA